MFDVIFYAPSHKDHISFRFYKDTGQAENLAGQVIKKFACPVGKWKILGFVRPCGENFYKVINWEKLAVNDHFNRKFMFLTKKCSQGVVCPCPWTIYIYMTIISNISSESTVF